MEMIYLLLPIIGAFVFLFLGCCFGRKMKEMLHIPKQVVLGRAVMEQLPGVRVQEESSESEDECPTIRVKFRDRRGRQLTGFIPSSASRDSVLPGSCSDSGVALLSASRQSIPPGTSVSALLKRRYLEVDGADSPDSRLSLDSAIHTSRTYNFSPVDSEDEESVLNDPIYNPRRVSGFLTRNGDAAVTNKSQSHPVTYGPPNWDHVVIIESTPDNAASETSSVTMVTDSTKQHSFQNVHVLYDSGLSIRDNPLSAIQQTQSLQDVNLAEILTRRNDELQQCHGEDSKRLSVSLCSLEDSGCKDAMRDAANDSSRNETNDSCQSDLYKDTERIERTACSWVSEVRDEPLSCDKHEDSSSSSSSSGMTPSATNENIENYPTDRENNSTETDATRIRNDAENDVENTIVMTCTTNTKTISKKTSSNNSSEGLNDLESCSNGRSPAVEPPGVFPLLNGVAALVDNMKDTNALYRKNADVEKFFNNNNCCVQVDPESNGYNRNVHTDVPHGPAPNGVVPINGVPEIV